jgi:hypothetical protein
MRSKWLAITFLASIVASCSSPNSQAGSPIEAIEQIRALAGFTESELTFIETTEMANSPHGDLKVDLYQDEEGRKFYVEPGARIVVEIDARNLMGIRSANMGSTSSAQLEEEARKLILAAVPEFSSFENSLQCETGEKVDAFFYDCREPIDQGAFMPRFIQVGFTTDGEMFGYINQLLSPRWKNSQATNRMSSG